MAERPIVIVGCPRSGTTLLSTMLHSHPRIAVAPETRFLLPVYRNRLQYGDLRDRANRRRLARAITSNRRPHFEALGIDRKRTIRLIVNGPPSIGSAFAIVWEEFARTRGKPRWGEKRPKYWRSMSSLQRLFPDAQFVHLIRDPRSCVASLLAAPWWTRDIDHSLTTWLLAERELRRFGRSAAPGTYHELRYEDLLADPRGVLQELTGFLDESFDEAMLTPAGAAADIVADNQVWHERTRGHLDPGRVDAWRHRLSAEQVGLAEQVARRAMARHGYRPSGTGSRPTPAARIGYRRQALYHAAVLAGEQFDELRIRRSEPNPVASLR